MNSATKVSYLDIKEKLLGRIHRKEWPADGLLPGEIELAQSFGCSRATVSRALNELAEEGIVTRKRRAGTRVNAAPDKYFRYKVQSVREQIEMRGALHGIRQIRRQYFVEPPRELLDYTGFDPDHEVFFVACLHMADGEPFLLEERWFDATLVPGCVDLNYQQTSAEDWLSSNYPFRSARYELCAASAKGEVASLLKIRKNAPVLRTKLRILFGDDIVSVARLTNQHGHIVKAGY